MPINNQSTLVGTHTVQANVNSELISDLKNLDFYVKKNLVKPIDNKIITIKESCYSNHYVVHINYVFFERLMKLTKITNIDTYKEVQNLVEICEKNRRNWMDVAEDDMVEELTQNINKNILKNLYELGTKNAKSNI
jgi:hypothetical protein